jgi:hypothetical protein
VGGPRVGWWRVLYEGVGGDASASSTARARACGKTADVVFVRAPFLREHAPVDDNDGAAPCPCQWHEALIDELSNSRADIAAWPGFVCGACYAASCECGYVFDDAAHAAGRDHNQRLVCHEPTCLARVISPV